MLFLGNADKTVLMLYDKHKWNYKNEANERQITNETMRDKYEWNNER